MALTEFQHIDLPIFVRRQEDGGLLLSMGEAGPYQEHYALPDIPPDRLQFNLPFLLISAVEQILFGRAFQEWQRRADETVQVSEPERRVEPLTRIILDIPDPALAAYPWERAFFAVQLPFQSKWRLVVVRVSPVRSRGSSAPFTLPLRILHVEPESYGALPGSVRNILGRSQPDEVKAQAVQVHECDFADLRSFLLPPGWATAEILHFNRLPPLNEPQTLLTTADPERVGTLGWFARVSDIWQTRCIIINCHTKYETAAALRLATALVNRGGPAILVNEAAAIPAGSPFFQEFYWQLFHDSPLDFGMMRALTNVASPWFVSYPSLFVGGGREEALRISSLGVELLKFGEQLTAAIERSDYNQVREMAELVYTAAARQLIEDVGEPLSYEDAGNIVRSCVKLLTNHIFISENQPLYSFGIETDNQLNQLVALVSTFFPNRAIRFGERQGAEQTREMNPDWTVGHFINALAKEGRVIPISGVQEEVEHRTRETLEGLGHSLSRLKDKWEMYTFALHESEGYIPFTKDVNEIRLLTGVRGPGTNRQIAPKTTGPRHVNASLWAQADGDRLRQLEQDAARLIVGKTYQLAIQIGPKDIHVRTVGETALIEEVFKWTQDMQGVWIEIALVGMDFEVLGDPVQELWLPREIPSDLIYFAVKPLKAGACRLRFCLYYRQNVVQSFRLAALTLEPDQKDAPARERRRMLAAALAVPQKVVGVAGYLPRLEYSSLSSIEGIDTRPPRRLSIVANDLDGRSVVSVKGRDLYGVREPGDLADAVTAVRKAFLEVSANKLDKEPEPTKWPYAFGRYAPQPDTLKAALMKMAYAGWRLYDAIFNEDVKNRLEHELKAERETIRVAHILLEKVIPWAAIYDRQYLHPDIDEEDVDGEIKPVMHDACLAALPDADGNFKAKECGTHPDCLLHPEQKKKYAEQKGVHLIRETVACPRHFWGFKHIIEIPPKQMEPLGATTPEWDCILSKGSFQTVAGMNARLKLWEGHWTNLAGLLRSKSPACRLATIRKALRNPELDFIYLYCHAGGGREDPVGYDPYLLFQDQQSKPEKMRAGDFQREPEWSHHPLVFLNGCGTVGFSPDALSPFINKLVNDLGAAGVIGTEVTVWEELATVVAEMFLKNFLAGDSAGEALLKVRRALLVDNNPLGLIYTLYAPAHLLLDKDGDGKCQKNNGSGENSM